MVAHAVYYQEQLYDLFKSEVSDLIENQRVGQLPWIIAKIKEFQYGDAIEWNGSEYAYPVIDETKQIITQAAASAASNVVTIKVAKGDIGSIEELDTDEKTALQYYLVGQSIQFGEEGILPAGMKMNLISEAADDLKLAYTIIYNPQLLNSNGELLSDTSVKPVETAITNYIQQLPFNSKFRVSALTDAIQAATGVVDVICDAADARYALVTYTDILSVQSESYLAYSGYLNMAENHGLDGYYNYSTNTVKTLTYVADE
jgi:hypothetical protein